MSMASRRPTGCRRPAHREEARGTVGRPCPGSWRHKPTTLASASASATSVSAYLRLLADDPGTGILAGSPGFVSPWSRTARPASTATRLRSVPWKRQACTRTGSRTSRGRAVSRLDPRLRRSSYRPDSVTPSARGRLWPLDSPAPVSWFEGWMCCSRADQPQRRQPLVLRGQGVLPFGHELHRFGTDHVRVDGTGRLSTVLWGSTLALVHTGGSDLKLLAGAGAQRSIPALAARPIPLATGDFYVCLGL